ncbi:hypothetical protein DIE04_27960 [Burkholderia sp. Bp8994]|nr:hypothetical protein DIE04_27960 [Burkholderia sp. Bp8994]RQS32083.1 hypothetical protein DIE01_31960 [Burkholderia sp. Bp8990]
MRNVIGQSFFCGSGCDARPSRAGDLPRAGDFFCRRGIAHGASPAGRSPRFRLRGTCQRERGEPIVGSQYACSKRNIGTML